MSTRASNLRGMPYAVQTPVFEGPFDLLLHLILQEEVEIFEVSLATIIDAYLQEVQRIQTLDLEIATEFLLIAATLIEIKVRRLLPGDNNIELDEELLRFEERDLLLARLLECKTFKDAALAFTSEMQQASRSILRHAGPDDPFSSLVRDPLDLATPAMLARAAERVFDAQQDPIVSVAHLAPIRTSVRDAIEDVLAQLSEGESTTFQKLVAGVSDRIEVIVKFLAVLELFKQGILDIEQVGTFGDLVVRRFNEAERDDQLDEISLAEWDDTLDAGSAASLKDDDMEKIES